MAEANLPEDCCRPAAGNGRDGIAALIAPARNDKTDSLSRTPSLQGSPPLPGGEREYEMTVIGWRESEKEEIDYREEDENNILIFDRCAGFTWQPALPAMLPAWSAADCFY